MPVIGNFLSSHKSGASGGGPAVNPDFVIEVDTTQAGSASDTIILPLESTGTYSGTIDWGDSNSDDLTYANRQHTYAAGGTYTITISGTTFEGWRVANSGDKLKFIDIQNWGFFTISSSDRQFDYCQNLDVTATDAPTITTTSFNNIFRNCDALTTPDFSGWDTSTVTNMREAFDGCALFNGNVSTWVHSNVTDLRRAFQNCPTFNQDLSSWNTSGVTNWYETFKGCSTFNGNVGGWRVGAGLNGTFRGCVAFTGIGVDSWNTTGCTSLQDTFVFGYVFNGDISGWDTSSVTNFSQTFYNAYIFNQDLDSWDVSSGTTFARMFYGTNAFNTSIDSWTFKSSGVSFSSMFEDADGYNQSMDSWNTGGVTNMSKMFKNNSGFNQSLSSWDVSGVTSFESMFYAATNFNGSLLTWDTSSATTMERMFQGAKLFNQPIGHFDTSNVLNFLYILYDADAFDQDISGWTVSQATNLQGMMQNTSPSLSTANYDALLIAWDAQGAMAYSGGAANFGVSEYSCRAASAHSSLTTKWGGLTDGGLDTSVNCDFISTWDTTQAGSASDTVELPLLSGGTYSGTIDWGDSTTSSLSYANRSHTYASSGTYTITISGSDIQGWQFNNSGDRRKITGISNFGNLTITTNAAFRGCLNMGVSATDAPILATTNLSHCWRDCRAMTSIDLSSWNVSAVTDMTSMFADCQAATSFGISGWDTSNVTAMNYPTADIGMFKNCILWNEDISSWDVSNVTNMKGMFQAARVFNQNIGSWDVSSVTTMYSMFDDARAFNQNIGSWNVSSVTSMAFMFRAAWAFNQNIGSWNVGNVTNMSRMFDSARDFNNGGSDSIRNWDISSNTTMYVMFGKGSFGGSQDTVFNQPIGDWNTSSVTNMSSVFHQNTAFDQDISNWDITNVTTMQTSSFEFGSTTPISTANYDALLIAWEADLQTAYPGGSGYTATITVDFETSQFTLGGAAATAKNSLLTTFGWTITDGGGV